VHIVCIERRSQYDSTVGFLNGFVAGFERSGHRVTRQAWDDPARPGADFVFSVGAAGVGTEWNIPFVVYAVDNPVFMPALAQLSPADRVLVLSGEHAAVVTDFLQIPVETTFVPLAAPNDPDVPRFTASRSIDFLVAGSYQPPARPAWSSPIAELNAAIEDTIELARERWNRPMRELDVTALFREAAAPHGVPELAAVHRHVMPILGYLDELLRVRRRAACIRALDTAGIRVHIAGAGWGRLELKNAVMLGQVNAAAMGSLVRDTRVVLNIGPPVFNEGWHTRVALALANGAACVTESNDYFATHAGERAVVDLYDIEHVDALPDIVRNVTDDPDRARTGYELVRDHHTWAHRADRLVRYPASTPGT
jgi:hypothetical protein